MTAIRYVRGTLPGLPGEHDIAVLEGDTHISRWVEESRRLDHDQNSLPIIGKLIGPESVVYDVGAFVGDHSCFYASKALFVVAFEALGDAFTCLCHNMREYEERTIGEITLICRAVGDGSWYQPAQTSDKNAGARHVEPGGSGHCSSLTIDTVADDTEGWTRKTPPPTFIKLDIEGWEVRALRGAERTIREHKPIIVCEVNRGALERAGTSPEELHALLTSYGYEMRDLFTEEVWVPGDERPQFDVVGRPKERAK